jgi:heptosyltransferase-1
MNILIVRLGALGDIVHTVPAAAALRQVFPEARIDWLVDARHRAMIDLITSVDRAVVLERPSIASWMDVTRRMRSAGYDVAIDFQGLMKSAVLARASGARRVIGFSIWHLREKTARPFYSEIGRTGNGHAAAGEHIIYKNLSLLGALGVRDDRVEFPLAEVESRALLDVRSALGGERPFALINPGAAWPNKRWPPERFGEVAAFLHEIRSLPSFVLWGPGEEGLAGAVVERSGGAARVAPPTNLADVLALSRAASLMVSGDTGPLHIAAAAGTPTVSLFGPTDPHRNGPWVADDVTVSRYGACGCHYERRCRKPEWCLGSVEIAEVTAAIQQRFQR